MDIEYLRGYMAVRTNRTDECWQWVGPVNNRGYGVVNYLNRKYGAHRIAFLVANDELPGDLTIDHLCFNTLCVNPAHLRAVTNSENARRQRKSLATHCTHGHPFDEANTIWRKRGGRDCRSCNNRHARAYQARLREVS